MTSTGLITKAIEQSLFNQYTDSSLAGELLGSAPQLNKTLSVENKLTSIPLNNTNISSVLVLDEAQRKYFATRVLDEHSDVFDSVLAQPLSDEFTLWLRDENGNIFLKKDIFQPK